LQSIIISIYLFNFETMPLATKRPYGEEEEEFGDDDGDDEDFDDDDFDDEDFDDEDHNRDLDELLEADEHEDADFEEEDPLDSDEAATSVSGELLDRFEDTPSVNQQHHGHILRLLTSFDHILHRYRSLARDPDLCRQICQVPGRDYIDPFHATRRWALSRMTDEHQQQLIDIWREGMSEWTQ
jgi:hypothetical protein